MEKVPWNTVNKKQKGLEQIKNEKHKSLARARANFPAVATSQNSEWIIYIISNAYNPFTAPGARGVWSYLDCPVNLFMEDEFQTGLWSIFILNSSILHYYSEVQSHPTY